MNGDLSGGLPSDCEYFLGVRPDTPGMRDSATLWVMDQSGALALPRVTLDAVAETWDTPDIQLNFVHADGRTLRVWSQEPGSTTSGRDGRNAVRSAGPLRLECVEPFRRWTVAFEGLAEQSTTRAEIAGQLPHVRASLAFELEAEMALPPWLMGGMTEEAARQMKAGEASALMGGVRYEQICRVRGTVTVDGELFRIEHATGMRVRRQGVRNMAAALGHCQHSALFPSGKAFGAIIMAKGPDGPVAFNEAFLYLPDGRRAAASVIRAPWMTRLTNSGDDATLVLDSEFGRVEIGGATELSMFDRHNFEMADTSVLHQGTARYVWDGEETIGLIERCTLYENLEGI
jgi:hypothetical protein